MAGPNLELFKFSLYLFFPLAIMIHYGDPQWYHDNVLPIRDRFWPDSDSLYKPPRNRADLRSALEDLRAQRLSAREQNQENGVQGSSISSSSGTAISVLTQPSLRPGGSLGAFSSLRRTGERRPDTATWREDWEGARRGRVV